MDRNQKPTREQIRQIEEAAKREIVSDEDSPELGNYLWGRFLMAEPSGTHQEISMEISRQLANYLEGKISGTTGREEETV